MGLVHIKSRITDDERKFLFNTSSDQSYLYLQNSEQHTVESFSLELTLGDGWSDRYSDEEKGLRRIDDEYGIKIARQGSVVVEVSEEIKMPHNLYGILVPTGSLFLGKGILIAPSKIEPSFKGKLKLRLFNTSNETYVLKKKQKLASAIFFSTDVTEFHKDITRASDLAQPKLTSWQKALRLFKQNPPAWVATLSPVAAILIFIATYFVFYLPSVENQKNTIEIQKKLGDLQEQISQAKQDRASRGKK